MVQVSDGTSCQEKLDSLGAWETLEEIRRWVPSVGHFCIPESAPRHVHIKVVG